MFVSHLAGESLSCMAEIFQGMPAMYSRHAAISGQTLYDMVSP
jgi:hypothetical protein